MGSAPERKNGSDQSRARRAPSRVWAASDIEALRHSAAYPSCPPAPAAGREGEGPDRRGGGLRPRLSRNDGPFESRNFTLVLNSALRARSSRRSSSSAGLPGVSLAGRGPKRLSPTRSSGLARPTTAGAANALHKVWPGESSRPKILRPLRRRPRAYLPLVRRQLGTGRAVLRRVRRTSQRAGRAAASCST